MFRSNNLNLSLLFIFLYLFFIPENSFSGKLLDDFSFNEENLEFQAEKDLKSLNILKKKNKDEKASIEIIDFRKVLNLRNITKDVRILLDILIDSISKGKIDSTNISNLTLSLFLKKDYPKRKFKVLESPEKKDMFINVISKMVNQVYEVYSMISQENNKHLVLPKGLRELSGYMKIYLDKEHFLNHKVELDFEQGILHIIFPETKYASWGKTKFNLNRINHNLNSSNYSYIINLQIPSTFKIQQQGKKDKKLFLPKKIPSYLNYLKKNPPKDKNSYAYLLYYFSTAHSESTEEVKREMYQKLQQLGPYFFYDFDTFKQLSLKISDNEENILQHDQVQLIIGQTKDIPIIKQAILTKVVDELIIKFDDMYSCNEEAIVKINTSTQYSINKDSNQTYQESFEAPFFKLKPKAVQLLTPNQGFFEFESSSRTIKYPRIEKTEILKALLLKLAERVSTSSNNNCGSDPSWDQSLINFIFGDLKNETIFNQINNEKTAFYTHNSNHKIFHFIYGTLESGITRTNSYNESIDKLPILPLLKETNRFKMAQKGEKFSFSYFPKPKSLPIATKDQIIDEIFFRLNKTVPCSQEIVSSFSTNISNTNRKLGLSSDLKLTQTPSTILTELIFGSNDFNTNIILFESLEKKVFYPSEFVSDIPKLFIKKAVIDSINNKRPNTCQSGKWWADSLTSLHFGDLNDQGTFNQIKNINPNSYIFKSNHKWFHFIYGTLESSTLRQNPFDPNISKKKILESLEKGKFQVKSSLLRNDWKQGNGNIILSYNALDIKSLTKQEILNAFLSDLSKIDTTNVNIIYHPPRFKQNKEEYQVELILNEVLAKKIQLYLTAFNAHNTNKTILVQGVLTTLPTNYTNPQALISDKLIEFIKDCLDHNEQAINLLQSGNNILKTLIIDILGLDRIKRSEDNIDDSFNHETDGLFQYIALREINKLTIGTNQITKPTDYSELEIRPFIKNVINNLKIDTSFSNSENKIIITYPTSRLQSCPNKTEYLLEHYQCVTKTVCDSQRTSNNLIYPLSQNGINLCDSCPEDEGTYGITSTFKCLKIATNEEILESFLIDLSTLPTINLSNVYKEEKFYPQKQKPATLEMTINLNQEAIDTFNNYLSEYDDTAPYNTIIKVKNIEHLVPSTYSSADKLLMNKLKTFFIDILNDNQEAKKFIITDNLLKFISYEVIGATPNTTFLPLFVKGTPFDPTRQKLFDYIHSKENFEVTIEQTKYTKSSKEFIKTMINSSKLTLDYNPPYSSFPPLKFIYQTGDVDTP